MRKVLSAAALLIVLGTVQLVWVAAPEASVLKGVRLKPGAQASELVLAIDGGAAYSVEREGAATLKVRLPGAEAASGVSGAGLSDERVVSVAVESSGGGLVVRLRGKVKRLGYLHFRSGGAISVRVFADAPGLEAPESPKAVNPAKEQAKREAASKAAKAEAKRKDKKATARAKAKETKEPAEPSSQSKQPEQAKRQAAAAPQKALPQAAPTPQGAPPQAAGAGPFAPLLTLREAKAPTKQELPEMPESTPSLGGVLPSAKGQTDELMARLLRSRDSEAAYAGAVARLRARDWTGALSQFRGIQTSYPGTLAAARSAFRIADCLYATAARRDHYEAASKAYLEAVNKWPLKEESPRAYLQIGRLYQLGGYDYEALGYYGLTVKQQPDGAYALYAYLHRGDIYFARGDYRQAQTEYCEVGRRFPNSARVREANFKLVRTLFAQHDFAGVDQAYRQMRARWPETFATDPDLLRYIGETYFQQGDYAHCREFLFYVLNIYPDSATNHLILCRIGDSFLLAGKQREAEKIYRLLTSTFPGTEGAQVARMRLAEGGLAEGRALIDGLASGERRLGDSKVYEEIAGGTNETAQRARMRLALWSYWRRDYLKAAQALTQLLQDKGLSREVAADCRYGVSEALYRQLKSYFDQGRYSEAARLQGTWGAWMEGERAETFYYLGESLRRLHLAQDAARALTKAQGMPWREDRRQETLHALGLARLETGEYAEAVRVLRQLSEAYPGYPWRPEVLRSLGKAQYLSGRYQEAVASLEEALRLKQGTTTRAEDCYSLGLALMGLKDYARAAAAFQEALSAGAAYGGQRPSQAEASLQLGNALYALQRWEGAAAAFNQVVRAAPGTTEAQQAAYKAGRCYVALGRPKDASASFGRGAAGNDGIWRKASTQMLDGMDIGQIF
jgi:TolA-binding protein